MVKKLSLAFCLVLTFSSALAKQPSLLDELSRSLQAGIDKAPATAEIESAFSPDGAAERLVLKTINSANTTLRIAAYSFTSPKIVQAILSAKKRGVDVQVRLLGRLVRRIDARDAIAPLPQHPHHERAVQLRRRVQQVQRRAGDVPPSAVPAPGGDTDPTLAASAIYVTSTGGGFLIESLPPADYDRMGYYDRWVVSLTQTMIQRGVITTDELARKLVEVEKRGQTPISRRRRAKGK